MRNEKTLGLMNHALGGWRPETPSAWNAVRTLLLRHGGGPRGATGVVRPLRPAKQRPDSSPFAQLSVLVSPTVGRAMAAKTA